MASTTVYGTNYTVADNVTPSTALNPAKWTGDIKHISDVISVNAVEAASLVYCGKLPIGAIPLYTIFNTNDATTTATGIIGYAGDTNALGAITSMSVTPTQVVSPTVWNTPLTAAQDVYITTAADTTEATRTWNVTIAYSVEG